MADKVEVYLSEYRGTDEFTVPVAMKIFSPERYASSRRYDEAMSRIAKTAARVALIQHDKVLDVQNFFERDRIRVMIMEWIDGYDLRRLVSPECLQSLEATSVRVAGLTLTKSSLPAAPCNPGQSGCGSRDHSRMFGSFGGAAS